MQRKIIDTLKKWEQKFWPEHTYNISRTMGQLLEDNPFVIADVGAAYGTDTRWIPIENYSRFVTFEPDVRSQDYTKTSKTVTFATGLSDHQTEQPLYLTKLPAASSLYPLNGEHLRNFANYEWHEVVGSMPIQLDTLDNCLAQQPELQTDFLKIDVEGADLDVLKGGVNTLTNSILGLQIEVSFIERHKGAPFFSETDEFLREHHFNLFILAREHWIRNNKVYGVNSNPQLIWADAVYLLSKNQFIERIKLVKPEERTGLLTKFLVILLAYGIHDYAIEIIDAVSSEKIITDEFSQELRQVVYTSVISPFAYMLRCLSGVSVITILYCLTFPILPFRSRIGIYMNKHWGNLLKWLAKTLSRGGLYNSALSDAL